MTKQQWDEYCLSADTEMKAANGHQYVKILKTRCQLCGRSPKQGGHCSGWFKTFMTNLEHELSKAGVLIP